MKKNLSPSVIKVLTLALCVFNIFVVAAREYQTKYGTIYTEADYPPVFFTFGHSSPHSYMRANFKYPKEAWKQKRVKGAVGTLIILANGDVAEIEFPEVKNEVLEKELKRVVRGMKFRPASNNGEPVNVEYRLSLRFTEYPWEGNSLVPFGLEKTMDDGIKIARSLSNASSYGTDKLREAENVIGDTFEVLPEYASTSLPYVRLLATLGEKQKAVEVADTFFSAYHALYKNVDSIMIADNMSKYCDGLPRPGYNGRTEVAVAVMRALQHDIAGIPVKAQAARDAMNLIDRRIIDGDLSSDRSAKDIARSRREIEKMQADMIQEFSRDRVQPDIKTPAWEKVTDFYSIGELSSALSYWDDRYDFGNAQVSQLKERIRAERENIVGGSRAKGDVLNLFGTKAFIHWLEGGNEGVSAYIASLRQGNPSKKLASYLDRLEKRLKENSELLADREGVVQSLACLVPPSGTSEADAEAFYARRRAAERVFPLRWLMK